MTSLSGFYLTPQVEEVAHLSLPEPRQGPRPLTSDVLPHQQLDQWPPKAVVERLWRQSLKFPNIYPRQSRMASPETQALCLTEELACGPAEAFIDNHEFCHLHPVPAGSVHLTLPGPFRQVIVQLGWAEEHPIARAGCLTDCLVMVYAPRNAHELTVVLRLIRASRDFAAGAF